ncbi:WW domain-binding protein 2 isoform X1 [Danaus plexippus]|uniref:WW domain-binding protein 2 n=1 Tax=Danaus plexippus plexippus TaxID=278856 RepID=A0A212ELE2_DANPL|nr:WW domain-binding protein 2 isoform X1 [Danaus plexippus]OWR42287.1 WW domain-binding protein 2 [Danaus plexippus plexippus]
MSLNTAHADHGVLIHAGECIILFSDNVLVEFYGNDTPEFKGSKNGRMYLTTHRMIYNSKNTSDNLRSFSFPFIALQDVTVEQPMFSANSIKGKVRAQPNGNFIGEVKFKLTFKSGGAIEFGQAMLKAAHLASRHMSADAPPPPYMPPSGPWYAAPPPAYAPPPQGYYGWVPPYAAFPDQPSPNSVFVSNSPPPYPGVMGVAYPPAGGISGATSPTGALAHGYPNAPGYPGNNPPGYPGNMPPPGYPGGFAPTSGMSSSDAKAAEAAQSAYYDPNKPQTAYVPPPYDQPPTYQESLSKKEN